MTFLRPPRGIFNDRVLAVSKAEGYTSVFLVRCLPGLGAKRPARWKYAYDNVMAQLHPGAVILLHAVSKDNADALGRIIDAAREKGYTFKPLNELESKTY